MSWWEVLVASVIQGATEFLPISSSGHLVLVHHWWGVTEPTLLVDVALHIGTTLAILCVYRQTLGQWCRQPRQIGMVVLALMPTGVIGLALREQAAASTLALHRIGIEFLITAGWLMLGQWASRPVAGAARNARPEVVRWWQALAIGAAQGLAVMPAISRSGATISAALLLGVAPRMAVEFSLLLSVPAVLGALGLELLRAEAIASHGLSAAQLGAAVVITWGVGWLSIALLRRVTERRELWPFAAYCALVGCWLVTRA